MGITILKLSWGSNDFYAFLRYFFHSVIRDYALNFHAKWLSMLRSHSYVIYSIGIFYFNIYGVEFHAGYKHTKIILGTEWIQCVFAQFLWKCNTRLRTQLPCEMAVYVEVSFIRSSLPLLLGPFINSFIMICESMQSASEDELSREMFKIKISITDIWLYILYTISNTSSFEINWGFLWGPKLSPPPYKTLGWGPVAPCGH
jgi:hypothetical protein